MSVVCYLCTNVEIIGGKKFNDKIALIIPQLSHSKMFVTFATKKQRRFYVLENHAKWLHKNHAKSTTVNATFGANGYFYVESTWTLPLWSLKP